MIVLPPETVFTLPRLLTHVSNALFLVTLSAMTLLRCWMVVAMMSLIAALAKAMVLLL